MFYFKIYTIVYLYFENVHFGSSIITKEDKTRIIEFIANDVKIFRIDDNELKTDRKYSNPYFLKISIPTRYMPISSSTNRKLKHDLILYSYTLFFEEKPTTINKFIAFYYCINCQIAFRTQNSLFELINDLPLFYQNSTSNDKYLNEFQVYFDSTYRDKLQGIENFIDAYIDVLNTLISVEPHAVLSNETIILQSLYVLKLKIFCFVSTYSGNRTTGISDGVVIREFLEIIIVLQSFIVVNCKEHPQNLKESFSNNRPIYSISINLSSKNNMINFLYDVTLRILNTDSQQCTLCCNVSQMLLENILMYNGYMQFLLYFSAKVGNAVITLENGETMTIMHIFVQVQLFYYDIVVIYFYMKCILNVIVALVHDKAISLLSSTRRRELNRIKMKFEQIKKRVEHDSFPKELAIYFDRLILSLKNGTREYDGVSIVINTMSNFYSEEFKSVQFEALNPEMSLESIVNAITVYKKDFECYNRLLKFLDNEFDKHYIPFIVDENRRKFIRSFVSETVSYSPFLSNTPNSNDGSCTLVDNIYKVCLEITIAINKVTNFIPIFSDKIKYIREVCEKFDMMKTYFSKTINFKTNDLNILKIAYNAVIVLVNFNCSPTGRYYVENHTRIVHLIMTELNNYGVKHCSFPPDRLHYMVYDNIDMTNVGNNEKIRNNVCDALGIVSEQLLSVLPLSDYEHFDLTYLYNTFVKTSTVVREYQGLIRFYWKGEIKDFKEIVMYAASNVVVNSQFLYVFYDLFFKFHLAAFYRAIEVLFEHLIIEEFRDLEENKVSFYATSVAKFSEKFFPSTLWPFITKLKRFALSLHDSDDSYNNKVFMMDSFKTQIEKWHIVFEFETLRSQDVNSEKVEKAFGIINGELPKSVEKVLKKYLLLHQQNDSEKNTQND